MDRRSIALIALGVLLTLFVCLGIAKDRHQAPAPGDAWKSTAADSTRDPQGTDPVVPEDLVLPEGERAPHATSATEPVVRPHHSGDGTRIPIGSAPPLDVELELMVGQQAISEAVLLLEGTGSTGPFVEQVEWSAESPRLRHAASKLTLTAYGGVVTNDGHTGIVARGVSERIELASADRNGTTVRVPMRARPSFLLGVKYEDAERPAMWAAIVPKRAFDPARPESAFGPTRIHMNALPEASAKSHVPERHFCVVELEPGPYVVGIGRPGEAPVSFAHADMSARGGGLTMQLPAEMPTERIRIRCTTPDGRRFNETVFFYLRGPGGTGRIPATLGADGWHWIDRIVLVGRKRAGRPRRAREGPITLEAHVQGLGARAINISRDEDEYAIQFEAPAMLNAFFVGPWAEGLTVCVEPLERRPVQEAMHRSAGGPSWQVHVQPGRYRAIASHSVSVSGAFGAYSVDFAEEDLDLVSGPNQIEFVVPPSHHLTIETSGIQQHATVVIRIVGPGVDIPYARADENGRVQYSGLPAGEYVLSAGEDNSTLEVTVPCRTVTYEIRPVVAGER